MGSTFLTNEDLTIVVRLHQVVGEFLHVSDVGIAEPPKVGEMRESFVYGTEPEDEEEVWIKQIEVKFLACWGQIAVTVLASVVKPLDPYAEIEAGWHFNGAELQQKCTQNHLHRVATIGRDWKVTETNCSLPRVSNPR